VNIRGSRIRRVRLASVAVVAALVVGALGAVGGGAQARVGAANAPADTEGVLKLNWELNTPELKLDPVSLNSPVEGWVLYMIYDTLLRQKADGTYGPGLAKSATVVDAQTIEVELFPDLVFQDGTTLDAEAAKASILRNKAANSARSMRVAELGQVADIVVDSPTNFTIKLSSPIAGSFYNLLAHNETIVVPPTAAPGSLDANPVGAGPFRFVSRDAETLRLEKSDTFRDAKKVKLSGVEIVNINAANTPALINALRDGAVDAAVISYDTVPQLQAPPLETEVLSNPDAVVWISMQCQAYPDLFGKPEVRMALNYATDKEALNRTLLGGEGEAMSQFVASDSKYYDDSLANSYDYNLKKAKKLLADADVTTPLPLTMSVPQQGGLVLKVGEVLQQQWKKAGIDLSLVPGTNAVTDYYVNKTTMTYPTVQSRFWTDKITRNFMPGSVGNTCDPQNPEFTADVNRLRGLDPNDPAAVKLWKDVQGFLNENAYAIYGVMNVESRAWNDDRVGNATWRPNQLGNQYPDVINTYIKRDA
jgi:peptide/nickel transport system substrate-binding protein